MDLWIRKCSSHVKAARVICSSRGSCPQMPSSTLDTSPVDTSAIESSEQPVQHLQYTAPDLYANATDSATSSPHPFPLLLPHPSDLSATTAAMPPNMSLFSINAILLLSADDNSRILTKYYSPPHPPANAGNNYPGANPYPALKDQKAFEKGLLEKTAKQSSDVILYDNRIVVFKAESEYILWTSGKGRKGRRRDVGACVLTMR